MSVNISFLASNSEMQICTENRMFFVQVSIREAAKNSFTSVPRVQWSSFYFNTFFRASKKVIFSQWSGPLVEELFLQLPSCICCFFAVFSFFPSVHLRCLWTVFVPLFFLLYFIMGASEITANLYCNCVHLFWEGCVKYIIAVIYKTRSMFTNCIVSLPYEMKDPP